MSARSGLWISIDGTEGTGKTTVTGEVIARTGAIGINEFSNTLFGEALRTAVRTTPHFISKSELGQSLVFLGDFIELYEAQIVPALAEGLTVVTDRGWLTKFTYQRSVLDESIHAAKADELLLRVLGLVPPPDLTILLTAPMAVVRARLLERDDHCSDARASFIENASEAAYSFLKMSPILNWREVETDRPVEDVVREVIESIEIARVGVQLGLDELWANDAADGSSRATAADTKLS